MSLTREIAERWIDLVAEGQSIKHLTREAKIGAASFWTLLAEHPDLKRKYELVQEGLAEMWVEEAQEIADTGEPMRARNQIDIRKWRASKVSRKYADKVNVDVSGSIDLTAAIAEATARRGASVLPAPHDAHSQIIDVTPEPEPKALDCKSGDEALAPAPVPDPFS